MSESLNVNLLQDVEAVSSAASQCKLNFSELADTGSVLHLKEFLDVSTDQAVLFSCLAELSLQRNVTLDSLAKHLKSSTLRIIDLMHELETLERKNYLCKYSRNRKQKYAYNDLGFNVPHSIMEALRTRDKSKLERKTKFDLPNLLEQIFNMLDERKDGDINTSALCQETEFLIRNNRDLSFVSLVDNSLTEIFSKVIVFAMAYSCFKGLAEVSVSTITEALCDDFSIQLDLSQSISAGNHEIIKKDFIRIMESDFMDNKGISLTPKIRKMLYLDHPSLYTPENMDRNIIYPLSINPKKLFFNEQAGRQVKELTSIIMPRKLNAYMKNLKSTNLPPGITIMFYGPSGTGKTECVYQIARKTGRLVMQVDLSLVKSKWFGESEKQVRRIFDDYNLLRRRSETEPILFINEADGLFSKRMDFSGRGTSTEQSLNTMQNIMLQALEDFEGILLATTNLTDNLDAAFERRFMFRIHFPKPDSQARSKIWKSKLPELTQDMAVILGEKFELTGGQIDNHIRNLILQRVLHKDLDIFASLMESCEQENGFGSRKRVGFI